MLETSTDFLYNLYYFLLLFNGILCLIAMMVWHELGHILYFRLFKDKKVKVYYNKGTFEIGLDNDYNILSDEEYNVMVLFGIVVGIIPYIFLVSFNNLYILMLIPYLVGCRSDLKQLNISTEL